MATVEEATRTMSMLGRVATGDPHGVRTIHGARAAYLRGDIDVVEFERRVELFLSGRPIAVLQPGEMIIRPGDTLPT